MKKKTKHSAPWKKTHQNKVDWLFQSMRGLKIGPYWAHLKLQRVIWIKSRRFKVFSQSCCNTLILVGSLRGGYCTLKSHSQVEGVGLRLPAPILSAYVCVCVYMYVCPCVCVYTTCLAPASGGWLWSVIITALLILPPPPVSLSWLLCLSLCPLCSPPFHPSHVYRKARDRHRLSYILTLADTRSHSEKWCPCDLQWPLCRGPHRYLAAPELSGPRCHCLNSKLIQLRPHRRGANLLYFLREPLFFTHLRPSLSAPIWGRQAKRHPGHHRVGLRVEQAPTQAVIRRRRGHSSDQSTSLSL